MNASTSDNRDRHGFEDQHQQRRELNVLVRHSTQQIATHTSEEHDRRDVTCPTIVSSCVEKTVKPVTPAVPMNM